MYRILSRYIVSYNVSYIVSRSEERSIQLAVRVHKTLELADDKFYVITCGKSGFGRSQQILNIDHLKYLEEFRCRIRSCQKAQQGGPSSSHIDELVTLN
uniref:Uncharacterized protein n=1 Tax=Glossina brevipalpis TaxID=37001 RepID=A0A1A9WJQ6_9MUSC